MLSCRHAGYSPDHKLAHGSRAAQIFFYMVTLIPAGRDILSEKHSCRSVAKQPLNDQALEWIRLHIALT